MRSHFRSLLANECSSSCDLVVMRLYPRNMNLRISTNFKSGIQASILSVTSFISRTSNSIQCSRAKRDDCGKRARDTDDTEGNLHGSQENHERIMTNIDM